MFKIGNFDSSDNPESSSHSSKNFEKVTTPSEADKQKLERTGDAKPKYSYTPEKNDSGKDKLSDKASYAYHWDGKPTHNTDWDSPASPATKQKVLSRW